MNQIGSHRQVDEGVTVRSCRIKHLVLLSSSEQSLQHALDWFSAACNQAARKVSNATLQQVEKISTLGWDS